MHFGCLNPKGKRPLEQKNAPVKLIRKYFPFCLQKELLFFEDNVGKAKATWNGINTLLSRKKNFAPVSKLIIGDKVITDPHELSNAFNRHFVDIGPNLAANISPPRVSFRDFVEPCDSTFELELLTIDHEILLSKLELYGFKCVSLNLFRDYLSDRTQVTVINNVNSETSFISCGVPQGSILGPLLFLLYINDLPNCNLLSEVRMYADETNLTFASKDPNELFSSLTHDLGNLKQWLDSNRLSLNVLKTKCLFSLWNNGCDEKWWSKGGSRGVVLGIPNNP